MESRENAEENGESSVVASVKEVNYLNDVLPVELLWFIISFLSLEDKDHLSKTSIGNRSLIFSIFGIKFEKVRAMRESIFLIRERNDKRPFKPDFYRPHIPYVNCPDSKGNTLLHAAVASRDIELVSWLLRLPNIKVNIQDANGNTPLQLALLNMKDNWQKAKVSCLSTEEIYLDFEKIDPRILENITKYAKIIASLLQMPGIKINAETRLSFLEIVEDMKLLLEDDKKKSILDISDMQAWNEYLKWIESIWAKRKSFSGRVSFEFYGSKVENPSMVMDDKNNTILHKLSKASCKFFKYSNGKSALLEISFRTWKKAVTHETTKKSSTLKNNKGETPFDILVNKSPCLNLSCYTSWDAIKLLFGENKEKIKEWLEKIMIALASDDFELSKISPTKLKFILQVLLINNVYTCEEEVDHKFPEVFASIKHLLKERIGSGEKKLEALEKLCKYIFCRSMDIKCKFIDDNAVKDDYDSQRVSNSVIKGSTEYEEMEAAFKLLFVAVGLERPREFILDPYIGQYSKFRHHELGEYCKELMGLGLIYIEKEKSVEPTGSSMTTKIRKNAY